MNNKGLFHDEKRLSVDVIVEKFRALQKKQLTHDLSGEFLREFVQFYAATALPVLFEATRINADLEELCVSDALCDFWDGFIHSEKYRAQMELPDRCAELRLQPQSSIPSYFLIKGLFYFYKYKEIHLDARDLDQLMSNPIFKESIACYSFQAFFDYTNMLINILERASHDDQKIDVSQYRKYEKKIHQLGMLYGGAGYIILANLYHSLFIYFGQVEKDGTLFYSFLYKAYDAIIHAELLSKYYLNDSFNALQGEQISSLLRNQFLSISSMKDFIKNTLLANNADFYRRANVKSSAIVHSNKLIQSNYQAENFSKESMLCSD